MGKKSIYRYDNLLGTLISYLILVLISVFTFFSYPINANTPNENSIRLDLPHEQWRFQIDGDSNFVFSLMLDNNGDVLIIYFSTNLNLILINNNGDILWNLSFPKINIFNDLIQCHDGNFILLMTNEHIFNSNIVISKFDIFGNIIWYEELETQSKDNGICIQKATDNEAIVLCRSEKINNDTNYGIINSWLIKIDNDGNEIWNTTCYGNPSLTPKSIITSYDNGFLLAADNIVNGSYDGYYGENLTSLPTLINIGDNGTEIWRESYDDLLDALISDVIKTSTEKYLIWGADLMEKQYWLRKLYPDGSIDWEKKIESFSSTHIEHISHTLDGNFILTGTYIEKKANAIEDLDCRISLIDKKGNFLWNISWGEDKNGAQGFDILQTSDGGFIVSVQTYGPMYGNFTLIKYSSIDNNPPEIIKNPYISEIGKSSATINIHTDEISRCFIEYGDSKQYGYKVVDENISTYHRILISNLKPNTHYFYRIGAIDQYNNGPCYSDSYEFTTLNPPPNFTRTVEEIVINEDEEDIVPFWFFDEEPLIIHWTKSSNIEIFINQTNFTIRGKKDWFGKENITFTISDGNNTIEDTVCIIVINKNDPPIFNGEIYDISFNAGETWKSSISPYFFDIDNDLEYFCSIDEIQIDSRGNFSITFEEERQYSDAFFYVKDSEYKIQSNTFNITINSLDTDSDGFSDDIDMFPTDPAASIDTDGDGLPDSWNPGKDQSDSTTGLHLDDFPADPSASIDSDGDGMPDKWNPGMDQNDSTSDPPLVIDLYPDDPDNEATDDDDSTDDDTDENGTSSDDSKTWIWASGIVVVIISVVIVTIILFQRKTKPPEKAEDDHGRVEAKPPPPDRHK